MHERRDWAAVAHLLVEHVERFPDRSIRARLMLAGVLAKELHRPQASLRILKLIDPQELSDQQRQYVQSVQKLAEQQVDEGVLELQELPITNGC